MELMHCKASSAFEDWFQFQVKLNPLATLVFYAKSQGKRDLGHVRNQNDPECLRHPINQAPGEHRILNQRGNSGFDCLVVEVFRTNDVSHFFELYVGI